MATQCPSMMTSEHFAQEFKGIDLTDVGTMQVLRTASSKTNQRKFLSENALSGSSSKKPGSFLESHKHSYLVWTHDNHQNSVNGSNKYVTPKSNASTPRSSPSKSKTASPPVTSNPSNPKAPFVESKLTYHDGLGKVVTKYSNGQNTRVVFDS